MGGSLTNAGYYVVDSGMKRMPSKQDSAGMVVIHVWATERCNNCVFQSLWSAWLTQGLKAGCGSSNHEHREVHQGCRLIFDTLINNEEVTALQFQYACPTTMYRKR